MHLHLPERSTPPTIPTHLHTPSSSVDLDDLLAATDEKPQIPTGFDREAHDARSIVRCTANIIRRRDETCAMVGRSQAPLLARKHNSRLHLPCFKTLGISALSQAVHGQTSLVPHANQSGSMTSDDPKQEPCGLNRWSSQISIPRYVDTLTPPAEQTHAHFHLSHDTLAAPSSQPIDPFPLTYASTAHGLVNPDGGSGVPVQGSNELGGTATDSMRSWTSDAIDALSKTTLPPLDVIWLTRGITGPALHAAPASDCPTKILSQALPFTSEKAHVYTFVIRKLQAELPTHIEMCHAVSGKFNLEDLPRSPPVTPADRFDPVDYFSQIFSTGVQVSDYQDVRVKRPPSPNPIVPPRSVNISIVERYIPPASHHEFNHMFDLTGPSILVDRLAELSVHSGSLLFIYPTMIGGETFMREYLGPVLDPQLRTMAVLHGFTTDCSAAIGKMAAVSQMLDFDTLREKIDQLCSNLILTSTPARVSDRSRAKFELVHASPQLVTLSGPSWAEEWWIKQEKQRIRDTIVRHTRLDERKHDFEQRTTRPVPTTELLTRLLDPMLSKLREQTGARGAQIEVGVFVIRRKG